MIPRWKLSCRVVGQHSQRYCKQGTHSPCELLVPLHHLRQQDRSQKILEIPTGPLLSQLRLSSLFAFSIDEREKGEEEETLLAWQSKKDVQGYLLPLTVFSRNLARVASSTFD